MNGNTVFRLEGANFGRKELWPGIFTERALAEKERDRVSEMYHDWTFEVVEKPTDA